VSRRLPTTVFPGSLVQAVVPSTTKPFDLAAVATFTLFGLLAALLDWPSVLRVPLGLLFVLVAPGYAFIALLYPERHRESVDGSPRRGLEPLERTALSLGLSIAVVPLLGLALNFTPLGIRLVPVLSTVAIFTLGCTVGAVLRRRALDADDRFRLHWEREGPPWSERTRLDKALTIALVLAVIFAAASLVYVLVKPRDAERFTEFYILGPTGKAACYPAKWDGEYYQVSNSDLAGQCSRYADNVTVGIVNHEGRDVTYHLRVVWMNETRLPDNSTQVNQVWMAFEQVVVLPHVKVDLSLDASFTPQYEFNYTLAQPPINGTLRLAFQLFKDTAPAPMGLGDVGSPYRRLHLWIDANLTPSA
jgi:uncharacterized membrane protein